MKKSFFLGGMGSAIIFWGYLPLFGATPTNPTAIPTQENVRYVGAVTCQSSMCHGGASPSRNQFTIWSHQDFHSRAYATLTTARSVRMAESLGLTSATESTRCTICHAPMADLKAQGADMAATVDPAEGVSCESCHNSAGAWLRGHTRPDWTYADRVHAGMRDLRSAYVRAATCVTCHQVIDPALIKAGHPELIFELDGLSASEPRHWREKEAWFGPKAWLVGQAVALSKISGQVATSGTDNKQLNAEQSALCWLIEQVPGVSTNSAPKDSALAISAWSNQLAQTISGQEWKEETSTAALIALASTSGSFTDSSVPLPGRELRAERLVLGLDRLFKSMHKESSAPGQAELAALFDAVQDRRQFNPQVFSSLLQKFADVVAPKKKVFTRDFSMRLN